MPSAEVLNRFAEEGEAEITSVNFCVPSPNEIRGCSVVEITQDKMWDKGEPRSGGVYDPLLGPITRRGVCATCGQGIDICIGHFGHIELPAPVFVPVFINRVLQLLRSVCFYCSVPLILSSSADIGPRSKPMCFPPGPERLAAFAKAATTLRGCRTTAGHPGCGCKQPTFVKNGGYISVVEGGEEGVHVCVVVVAVGGGEWW